MTRPAVRRSRNLTATFLGVIAVVGVLASVVGLWANQTLYDSKAFGKAVDRTLSNRQVTDGLAQHATGEVFRLLDVEGRIDVVVPDRISRATPILTKQLQAEVEQKIATMLADPAVRAQIVQAAERSHQELLDLVDHGRLVNVSMRDGGIQLNILPLITRAFTALPESRFTRGIDLPELSFRGDPHEQRRELSEAIGRPLPADFGVMTVYRGERVARAEYVLAQTQRALIEFRRNLTLILVVTAVAALATILVSTNRRKAALMVFAGGVVAFGVAALAIRRVVARAPLIAIDAANREAIRIMVTTLSNGLLMMCYVAVAVCAIAWGITWSTGRFLKRPSSV